MDENSAPQLHHQLLRQLKRANIAITDISPHKQDMWNEFLSRVSRTYFDYEQDNYLLERSMNISSREMMELNEKLEFAQHIARLGHWNYDCKEDKMVWSKEMFHITGIDPAQGPPRFADAMMYVPEEQRDKLAHVFEQAFAGESGDIEVQFKTATNKQNSWFYIKCHPRIDKDDTGSIKEIKQIDGIALDITERKKYEEETRRTHEKLLTMSRQAGMAEVASSVLHNIGNIMNSANVSINLLKESSMKIYCARLSKIIDLFNAHSDALDVYLTKDEKGKLIPSYLAELIGVVLKEYDKNSAEIDNIHTNLAHIKDIVAMQKAISGTAGFVEQVFVPDVIDAALHVINATKSNLIVEKDYEKIPFVFLDKSKLTQILINLLQNAKDAISDTKYAGIGKVKITIKNEGDKIKVMVDDNGIGIPEDIINKIFAFGFTTKDKGHGFGLHNSALLAKEMGGSLKAESAGVGEGATFILVLSAVNKNAVNIS